MHAFLTDLSEPLPLRLGRPLSPAGSRGQWEGPQVAEAGLSLPSEGVRRLGRGGCSPGHPMARQLRKSKSCLPTTVKPERRGAARVTQEIRQPENAEKEQKV